MESDTPQWLLDLQASTERFAKLAESVKENSEKFVIELREQARVLNLKKEKSHD